MAFNLAYVPGVSPGKWQRVWRERFPATPLFASLASADESFAGLRSREFSAALVRMPVPAGDAWHRIPLYEEVSVVVVPIEHEMTLLTSCTVDDLADEVVLDPPGTGLVWGAGDGAGTSDGGDDAVGLPGRRALQEPPNVKDAIEWCAASAGLVIVPMSLARLCHRKDVTYVPMTGVPTSRIALAWARGVEDPLLEELAGIVRGRGANSSRGQAGVSKSAVKTAGDGARASARAGGGAKRAQGERKPTPHAKSARQQGAGQKTPNGSAKRTKKNNNGRRGHR